MVGFDLYLFYSFGFSSDLMIGAVVSVENGCVKNYVPGVLIRRNPPAAVVWVFSVCIQKELILDLKLCYYHFWNS